MKTKKLTRKTKSANGRCLQQRVKPPRFYWKKCYELKDRTHWALCDTKTDSEAPPSRVSCVEMILNDSSSTDLDKQFMPKLIVELLNAHYGKRLNGPDQR